ncbi:carbamoyltransferase C-terminal domain-containing protein [Tardiphaga sp. 1201_B9_N1_1]|uniref:carbamoyltransferase C-terminal domain-containing protein n=1 Tax=unclassified Tardiphaga TaxID=2631404 RepID=UPI003F293AFF
MPQLILSVHSGVHDAAVAIFEDYDLKAAIALERLTRRKSDGSTHPDAAIDEVLSIAGATRRDVDVVASSRAMFPKAYFPRLGGLRWLREQYRSRVGKDRLLLGAEQHRYRAQRAEDVFDAAAWRRDGGFRDDAAIHFYNHHEAHALPTLFYSPWPDALLVTADGGGDNVNYSYRHFADHRLTTLYGDDACLFLPNPVDSLGRAYSAATKSLGFRPNRHEGKLTGLAAMGQPTVADTIAGYFSVGPDGRIQSGFRSYHQMNALMRRLAKQAGRADFAASIQKVLEDTMLLSLQRLLQRHPARHLGLSGGVFANVKLNRLLAEQLSIDELFIFPAMGDDGLPIGGALSYLMQRDGLVPWLGRRRDLGTVYLGRDFQAGLDAGIAATPGIHRVNEAPVDGAVKRLVAGEIGAIFNGRMEYGPRALGARTILANPARRGTHDLLNERLSRSEFMPFAPVITTERAAEVFDVNPVNARACRYMTIACDVKPEWRDRIPAVVHVDGSARPQVIARPDNPLYYDIVEGFARASGLPVLVNTSFNVHEEPIVNSPDEALRALLDGRIDFLVTTGGLYRRDAA